MNQMFAQPFAVTWRKALLSAPRLVPDAALKFTSPEGPHPFIINLPSRGTHLIPLYVFVTTPKDARETTMVNRGKLPVLIDFHGGGFIFGSCQEQAPFCAMMARKLDCISISVDYRLGPAAQHPAALEDAEDVIDAILKPDCPAYKKLRVELQKYLSERRVEAEIDTERIAVSGFSSGGNLALNLGLSVEKDWRVKSWPSIFPASYERSIPLLLFYPSLDCRQLPSERPRPPGMEEKKSFLKSLELESTLMPTYLPREEAGHPRASPGLVQGGLHKQAKMLLILPEFDTLAEQSQVWIEKVRKEGRGSDLQVEKIKGVVHGWTQFPDSWLSPEDKQKKVEIFEKAREFVESAWTAASPGLKTDSDPATVPPVSSSGRNQSVVSHLSLGD